MERCADPLMQLQIDEAILDYLLYTAIKALLKHLQSAIIGLVSKNLDKIEVPLQLVDCEISQFLYLCSLLPLT